MKRTHRSTSPRAIRLISFVLCCSLIVTTAFLPLSHSVIVVGANGSNPGAASSSRFGQLAGLFSSPGKLLAALVTLFQGGNGLPSVPGPNLPDLNAARLLQPAEPEALPPITSSQPNPDICVDCDPANHPPIADPGGPYFGSASQAIAFNGLGSRDVDPGDGISDYAWNFGDSSLIVHGATPSHTYQSAGNYTVSLTVTDHHDASRTANTTASVNAGPAPTPTPAASPTPSSQTNAAVLVSQSAPMSMTAGERYPVSVTMRNTGDTIWSAARLYRLASQNPQNNTDWGKSRVYLPANVSPGAEITFNFTVRAPLGTQMGQAPVHFQWRMVQDGVEWFGQTQDVVITVTTMAQVSLGDLHPDNLATARLDPRNRTGEAGEDLSSGNFNWMLNLLNLTGRAGLNLNLPLSYNSLAAWTKLEGKGTSMTFDAERGFPSVGFRLGFPSIRGPFSNNQTGKSAYMLNTPAGGHIELRQVDNTSFYESADSSYFQLLDGGNGSLLLRSPDGQQLAYLLVNGEYRCTEIKDRNGNYITVKYDPLNGTANPGRMTSIIDTLGRTINFNYENYQLKSITQLRGGQPHAWATFGYSELELRTNFAGARNGGEGESVEAQAFDKQEMTVLGLPENHTVSVLTQVSLDDGSRYNFEYTSWGQVYQITHHAADSVPDNPHPLSYVFYNLPRDDSEPQSDCPRFTQRQDWAENWNGNEPVTTTFQFDRDGQWGRVTAPDGTLYKEFFTTKYNDWRRGLVWRTEIYAPDDKDTPAKTTLTDWTQDDTSVAYPLNPRATAVTVSDGNGNRRRTTVDYTSFGLPSDVFEWGPAGATDWTILRRTHTDYNLSPAYLNRRLIGLVAGQYLFAPDAANSASSQTLLAKTTFEYDVNAICSGYCYTLGPEAPSDPVFHHDYNYGASFQVGRGLLAKVQRWDAFDESNGTKVTTSSMVYNVYGSLIRSVDPLLHTTQIHYTDSFSNDGTGSNPSPYVTMAYPTAVRDGDGYSSSVKYNYDLGVVTRQQDPKGVAKTTQYDSAGRVKRVTNAVNGAYTRFVYPPSQTIINKFTTIKNLATETYTATVFDGAGRVRAVAGDFPNPNSTGHYSGQFTLYDQQGRAVQSTNPTEMTHVWAAAGDDHLGWYSSSQTFDWKGRPLVTTNPDGTTKEASYSGCGCAGGEVVTLTDEGTLDGGVPKRRQQKIYSDILGRTVKTELLNWQGGTPYSTTVNSFNARDQVTLVRQYAGPDSSGTYQDTTMTYDGYARLKTKHAPEQQVDPNNSASTDHTTWDYFNDDTIQKITDARGASATYGYYNNNRHLVTRITYGVPGGSNIPVPATVTFGAYDAAGNRSSMSDGSGSVSYQYNQLSQLTSETRQFAYPGPAGSYTLSYPSYNLAGSPESITDPTGAKINYSYDELGRTTAITGSSFGGVTQYATNIKYRAWGAVKEIPYGNGHTVSAAYNARLQPTHFEIPGVMAKDYQYQADGRIRYSADLLDNRFDRSYSYDHAGRIKEAFSGPLARGQADTSDRPYKEFNQYDAMDHLVGRVGSRHWTKPLPNAGVTDSFVNNRNPSWEYDADGNLTNGANIQSTFDAAGRAVTVVSNSGDRTQTRLYDGDGGQSKLVEVSTQDDGGGPYTVTTTRYSVSSSVVGEVITELNETGQKARSFVYNGSEVLAWQQGSGSYEQVLWEHRDASDASYRMATADGNTDSDRAAEMDPLGSNAGIFNPYTQGHQHWPGEDSNYPGFADLTNPDCQVNGIPVPCTSLNYEFWGSKIASLPGFGTNWGSFTELGLREYEKGKTEAMRANTLAHPPRLKRQGKRSKKEIKRARERSARVGKDEKEPQNILTIEHFNAGQESWIRYEMQFILTPKCDAAYEAEKLNSPSSIISNRGVVIRHAYDLTSRSAADLGLDPQTYRDAQRKVNRGQGGTVFGTDGRLHVFLNSNAFLGPSLAKGFASLAEVLKHEFIHEGLESWPDPTPIIGSRRHDLAGFPGYDRIMEGCR